MAIRVPALQATGGSGACNGVIVLFVQIGASFVVDKLGFDDQSVGAAVKLTQGPIPRDPARVP